LPMKISLAEGQAELVAQQVRRLEP
jgi:hypothetical protein